MCHNAAVLEVVDPLPRHHPEHFQIITQLENAIYSKLPAMLVSVIPLLLLVLLTRLLSAAPTLLSLNCSVPGEYGSIQDAVNANCETINVASGSFNENVTISRTVTIIGQGTFYTIVDGTASGSVFTIQAGGVVTLADLTITNGAAVNGGGIYNDGTTTLINSTLISNTATTSDGGGIFNDSTLTVTNSTLSGNSADSGFGGGIHNESGMVTLDNSTLSGNSASSGGSIANQSGMVTLNNSTLSGNSADSGFGGGIVIANGGTATLNSSTLNDNSAIFGGGIYNLNGTTALNNSIVANSPTGSDCSGGAIYISQGYNLDSDDTCNLTATGDITNTNPLLGPLHDNGGPTLTHALQTDSPSIDAGNCPAASADQRGYSRPVDILDVPNVADTCDIGAFEVQNQFYVYIPLMTKN